MIKDIARLKEEIVSFGLLLWDKDLVGGWNGNISLRVDPTSFLVTATGTCLGRLMADDIVLLHQDGRVLDGRKPSSETPLHRDIYAGLPGVQAVIHTHTVHANAFFLEHDVFKSVTFEGADVLGEVRAADQDGVNVRDTQAVVQLLERNPVVALRRHGVVSVGKDLFECFARIQTLEEQVKIEAVSRIFRSSARG